MIDKNPANRNRTTPDVTAIIQARMNSSRLPGKAMLELSGKPILYHIIERVKSTRGVKQVVLATCDGGENKELIKLAESMDINVFVGSADNVLRRFYKASEKFVSKYIMRVTGDNPFTDPEYASRTIDIALETGADICSIINLPLGTAVGLIKKEALDIAYERSDKQYQFEHVSPYIKEHPELFKNKIIELDEINIFNPFTNLRLTVDAQEDYELAKAIYTELYKNEPFHLRDTIKFLKKNPFLVKINDMIRQRNITQSSK